MAASNPLLRLRDFGQSVWLDFINRDILPDGLRRYRERDGVVGVTANPSIFEKAIAHSEHYRPQIKDLIRRGLDTKTIYETVAVEDVQRAADVLRPAYDELRGGDGFVSLECSPMLAHDTGGTLDEVRRLFAWIDRPNAMIKIPGTKEGVPAIEEALSQGININITLLFDLRMYAAVADAYMRALERRLEAGQRIDTIASVASFFVSRVDTETDRRIGLLLQQTGDETRRELLRSLLGRVAVANAQLAYELFLRLFQSERFQKLAVHGARVQRPLWASTSTKNRAYSDVLYVETLIGPDTVNTLPPETIDYFRDHGVVTRTIDADFEAAHGVMARLAEANISLPEITDLLLRQGIDQFSDAMQGIFQSIDQQREARARAEERPRPRA
jgi:transaldolase